MKILDLEQGSPEWLEFRRKGIGASDAPSIMGCGFKSREGLLKEKLNGSNGYDNAAMKRGRDLEPVVRQMLEEKFGCVLISPVVQHDEYEWCYASLDAISIKFDKLFEIKCPNSVDHTCALNGAVPKKYYPQLQHQLFVTGLPMMKYVSYDGETLAIVDVERDEAFLQQMIEAELDFYGLMQEGVVETLKEVTDPNYEALFAELKKIRDQIKELEELEQSVQMKLLDITRGEPAYGKGGKVIACERKGAVDNKRIYKEHNVDIEKYRGSSSTYFKFQLEKENGVSI